jgi:membrane protein implicated in regulation of membrane protease activity
MSAWQYWLIAGGALIAAELFIGSPMFVLLILGVAALMASIAAWFDAPIWAQLLVATLTCIAGYVVAVRLKKREPVGATIPLDSGGRVELVKVLSNLRAEVNYRGAVWTADSDRPELDWNGPLYVKEVRGTSLVVTSEKPN